MFKSIVSLDFGMMLVVKILFLICVRKKNNTYHQLQQFTLRLIKGVTLDGLLSVKIETYIIFKKSF